MENKLKPPNDGRPKMDFEIKAKVPLMFWKKKKLTAEEKQKLAIEKCTINIINGKLVFLNGC